ncbi:phosphotransferase family protein [Cryptosporangium sp. NPDC048952]|uniref:phosphotransferase family protein n=1 Tax=Cryptosporangium sp. NPDC048952 TaxID=3363961 RepID=UPI003715C08A
MGGAKVFSKGRDLDATARTLGPWLAARLGADEITLDCFTYPRGAGISNETILFSARTAGRNERYVLRIAPRPEYQMFLDPRFQMQYDILRTLRRLGTVRVPHALWYCDDTSILGQEFFLMRRSYGRVPVSIPVYNAVGWLTEATPAQRRTMWESAMRQFAAIHRIPPYQVRFVGGDGLTGQLDYWSSFAAWALGDTVPPLMRRMLDWLREHRPASEATGLAWGDARMGNMMFDDEYHVVAVMDWEQAALCDPLADLGWWLMFDEIHSVYSEVPRLEGLGSRSETIELWQDLTGRRVTDLHWHEVFACVKTGLLGLHTRRSMIFDGGQSSAPSAFIVRACHLLDLDVPEEI